MASCVGADPAKSFVMFFVGGGGGETFGENGCRAMSYGQFSIFPSHEVFLTRHPTGGAKNTKMCRAEAGQKRLRA